MTLERCLIGAEEKNNQFILSLLGKQQNRIKNAFDRHIVSGACLLLNMSPGFNAMLFDSMTN